MDLDEMRDQVKKVRAPGVEQGVLQSRSIDDLIVSLKAEDTKDNKTFRRATVFFAIAGALYVGIFALAWIAPPDNSPNLYRVLLGMFALVFLSIGIYSRVRSRALSAVEYAEPVRAFLARAEKRYQFIQTQDLIYIVPYVVILSITCSVACMAAAQRYLPSLDPAVVLISCCIFFPVTWVVGFVLGRRAWKKRKEPLLEEIREMQAALTANGNV